MLYSKCWQNLISLTKKLLNILRCICSANLKMKISSSWSSQLPYFCKWHQTQDLKSQNHLWLNISILFLTSHIAFLAMFFSYSYSFSFPSFLCSTSIQAHISTTSHLPAFNISFLPTHPENCHYNIILIMLFVPLVQSV